MTWSAKCEWTSQHTRTLKRLLGKDNIVGINFGYTAHCTDDCQTGWCHIQCLNGVVYKESLHKPTYILERMVDIILYKGSIDGMEHNKLLYALHKLPLVKSSPKRYKQWVAMPLAPLVIENPLNKTINELVKTVDGRASTFTKQHQSQHG